MPENLNKKIIELESKFSILIKKYNELKIINNKLNEELTGKEIELIIRNYQLKNSSKLSNDGSISHMELQNEIDSTINELDEIIKNLKN
tara:strand:+ start:217 stop:483 length:267 start_codon:yes stop_codon:yes gene_type:complete